MEPDIRRTPYRRLKVSLLAARDAAGRAHSLWLADDHLLWVRTGYFAQMVSRIDYRDVEAIVQRPTARYAWTNLLAALPCVLGTGLLAAAPRPWAILGICLLLPCLLVLLINLLLGRTCECRLQTRVGTRTLAALNREDHVRRALSELVPHIEAAQAGLPPVSDRLLLAAAAAGNTPPAELAARARPARLAVHAVCFGVLAVQALCFVLVVRFTSVPMLLACLLWAMLLVVACLVTVGLQHRRGAATRLCAVTWIATAGTLIGWTVGYLLFWFALFNRGLVEGGFSMENQLDRLLLRFARELAREGLPEALSVTLVVAAVLAALVALFGFAAFLSAPPAVSRTAADRPPPDTPSEGR